MTTYIVLHQVSVASDSTDPLGHETWAVHTHEVKATSAAGAIRSALGKDDPAGTYVAVPARSWNPQPVSVEATTSVKIGAH